MNTLWGWEFSMNKAKLGRRRRSELIFVAVLLFIPILHLCFFWVYVNIDTIVLSFQRFDSAAQDYVFSGVENYAQIFREFGANSGLIRRAVLNSFLVFFWNDLVLLPVSLAFAYILFRGMPGAQVFRVIFFLPCIISVVVLTMVFGFMFDTNVGLVPDFIRILGLQNMIPDTGYFAGSTALPMLLLYGLWSGIGNNIVLVNGAIRRIPTEIFDAAKLDGVSVWREFFNIVVPLIGGTIATLLLLGVTLVTGYFLQPMLLMPGVPEAYTLGYYIVSQVNTSTNLGLPAAMGNLCILFAIPLVWVMRKIVEHMFPAYEY